MSKTRYDEMTRDELIHELREVETVHWRAGSTPDRYSRLHDFAPVGYCALDADGRIVEINLTGAARDRLVERLSLLAEVGDRLAGPLDARKIAAAVTSLAVPLLADVCLIDPLDEGGGGPARAAHVRLLRSGEAALLAEVGDALLAETAPDEADRRVVRAAGPVAMLAVPLRAGGQVTGALTFLVARARRSYGAEDLVLAQEIARRASMAMDSARLYERAQRAIQAREDLLAVVSHDLRNPLNVVLGNADMMLRGSPVDDSPARSRRATEAILRSAERMNRLIGDLLDASSIEAGRFSVERSVQAADAIVFDAIEAVEGEAAQKALRLDAQLAGDARVLCDRGRVLQVFSNLVGNAIKFTPRGGSIAIRVEPRGDEVWFFVADTGPGIPEDQLPHIFERFWQAKRTARLGTGLGLSIAKGIVEAHGGQVGVESRAGGGSTFFFTLPRAESRLRDAHDEAV